MKKFTIFKSLFLALVLCVTSIVSAQTTPQYKYVKVTSAPTVTVQGQQKVDWSGTYLIVSEDYDKIFNGAGGTNKSVIAGYTKTSTEITPSDKVTAEQLSAAAFTFSAVQGGYYIKTSNNQYIYNSGTSNGIKISETAGLNTIDYIDGLVKIYGKDKQTHLQKLGQNNTNDFKYYGSTQKPIQLYKQVIIDPNAPAAPTFSTPAGDVTEAFDLTLASTTTDAAIYYTLDGTEPSATTTKYESPIHIAKTTTVKAIAINGEYSSSVVSATYYFPPTNIAEFIAQGAAKPNTDLTIKGEVLVTYVNGTKAFISDASGSLKIEGTIGTIAAGDKISGIVGKYTDNSGKYISLKPTTIPAATSAGNAVEPVVVTPQDLTDDNLYKLVTLKNAELNKDLKITTSNNSNFYDAVKDVNIALRNEFKAASCNEKKGTRVDIVAILGQYNNLQLQLISVNATPTETPVLTPAEGSYAAEVTVEMTTATEGADVFYKLGEAVEYTKYTAPLVLRETTKVEAITAFANADGTIVNQSAPATATYTVSPALIAGDEIQFVPETWWGDASATVSAALSTDGVTFTELKLSKVENSYIYKATIPAEETNKFTQIKFVRYAGDATFDKPWNSSELLTYDGSTKLFDALEEHKVMGINNDWATGETMAYADGQFSITLSLQAGTYSVKVKSGSNGWYGINNVDKPESTKGLVGADNIEFTLTEADNVTITHRLTDGKLVVLAEKTQEFGKVIITSYTLVGNPTIFGKDFDPSVVENDMVAPAETEVAYTKVYKNVDLTAGAYNYKVVGNHNFSIFEFPKGEGTNETINIDYDWTYDLEFSFIPAATEGDEPALTVKVIPVVKDFAAAPVATAATDILETGFTANWDALEGATSYELSVNQVVEHNNLVVDGSLESVIESGTGSQKTEEFDKWSIKDAFNPTTEKAHSGSSSAKATAKAQLNQTVTIVPGKTYTFSFWYTGYAATNTNGLKNYTKDGTDNIEAAEPVKLAKSPDAWKQYTCTFIAKTSTLKISIRAYEACYIDDVAVFEGENVVSSIVSTPVVGSPFTVEGATSQILLGLQPSSNYEYSVVAKGDNYNNSDASNVISVTTLALPVDVTTVEELKANEGKTVIYRNFQTESVGDNAETFIKGSDIEVTAEPGVSLPSVGDVKGVYTAAGGFVVSEVVAVTGFATYQELLMAILNGAAGYSIDYTVLEPLQTILYDNTMMPICKLLGQGGMFKFDAVFNSENLTEANTPEVGAMISNATVSVTSANFELMDFALSFNTWTKDPELLPVSYEETPFADIAASVADYVNVPLSISGVNYVEDPSAEGTGYAIALGEQLISVADFAGLYADSVGSVVNVNGVLTSMGGMDVLFINEMSKVELLAPTLEIVQGTPDKVSMACASAFENVAIKYGVFAKGTVTTLEDLAQTYDTPIDFTGMTQFFGQTVVVKAVACYNGFAYSAVTELQFEVSADGNGVSVENTKLGQSAVYTNNSDIIIESAEGATVEVFTVQGQRIYAAEAVSTTTRISGVDTNIVIVRVNGENFKVILR